LGINALSDRTDEELNAMLTNDYDYIAADAPDTDADPITTAPEQRPQRKLLPDVFRGGGGDHQR
jgi:hypothetical protein